MMRQAASGALTDRFAAMRRITVIVIPAKDEQADVADVVQRARVLGFDVLVVDDCSADETARVAAAAGAAVLSFPFSVGAWVAMQTGLRYALKNGYRYAVTLDADGQHDPAAIGVLLDAMLNTSEPPNVVVGACPSRGSRGRKIAWRFFRRLGGFSVQDLTSGYRAYDQAAMWVVSSRAATLLEYQDVGVLLLLMERGLRIQEVKVQMAARAHGKSRIFQSWLRVFYYLLYSLLLCTSKRKFPRMRSGRLRGLW
jgi:glycosyltransferase involved in cell wall biosynthesis